MSVTPDWSFVLGDEPQKLDLEQLRLLDEIEVTLQSFGRRSSNPEQVMEAVRPLVRELNAAGLDAQSIASHSRIRPEGVRLMLEGKV